MNIEMIRFFFHGTFPGVLDRVFHLEAIKRLFRSHPVVAILGPRQIGKTTLARLYAKSIRGPVRHFDLEDADDLAQLAEPTLALRQTSGLVVIDEIQRRPELFPALRVLADRPQTRCRFLVLGSAAPELLNQSSETLAGRIAYHELPGFSLAEVGAAAMDRLWERGGFPRSFLAQRRQDSLDWREQFVRTFLERDIPQLGLRLPAPMLRRFWSMVAHYHGQIWNAAEIAGSLGLSAPTVRGYRDTLVSTFMLRSLAPWAENLGKRQVKSPKTYLADSGLLHTLLGIKGHDELAGHPKLGASWEGFVIGQLVERLGATPEECFFWATHQGAELDLLVVRGRKRLGFEIKRTTAPTVTKSMRLAAADLHLDELTVVYAGANTFALSEGIRAVAAERMLEDIAPLR
jgi:predicted AAA+ superfamily ATPase